MKKLLTILLLSVCMTALLAVKAAAAEGIVWNSDDKCYEISTYEGLCEFARLVNEEGQTEANAKLTDHIEATGQTDWTPIGNYNHPYTGTFDGQGYVIKGLTYNNSVSEFVGLFGYLDDNGTVQNIGLEAGSMAGGVNVGGVVGYVRDGTVTNCYNTGAVTGNGRGSCVGGVAGGVERGDITNCYNTGSITGNGNNTFVGGTVGRLFARDGAYEVTNCYNAGKVTTSGDNSNVGGVVGYSNDNTVRNCYYDMSLCEIAGAGVNGKPIGNRDTTDMAKGLTTSQMTGEAAKTYMSALFEATDNQGQKVWLDPKPDEKDESTGKYYWFYPHLKGFAYSSENGAADDWPSKVEVTVTWREPESYEYTGKDIKPRVEEITIGSKIVDYYVSYYNATGARVDECIDPGKYKAVINIETAGGRVIEKEFEIKLTPVNGVKYYDPTEENEEDRTKTHDGCISVKDKFTELKGNDTWYVVNSNVTINSRIEVNGTINLILADGCTLEAKEGIHLIEGNSLTIWGETKDGTGMLIAGNDTLDGTCIGGNAGEDKDNEPGGDGENAGVLTINGGNVTVQNDSGAGIGGGTGGDSNSENGGNGGNGGVVTINSGIVIAESNHGAGFGGGNGGKTHNNSIGSNRKIDGVAGSSCDLIFADGMLVYTPKDGTEPVLASERKGGCQKNSVKITKCTDHSEFFYIDNGDGTHCLSCKWCATKTTENHTYTDGICYCGAYIPPTVSSVTATASSPWDGTVSIDFTLSGYMPGRNSTWDQYILSVTATDNKTNKTYTAVASALSGDTDAAEGAHSIVWDLKAQGIEFTSSSAAFTVEYLYLPDYCVIDLSGSPEADTYPVTYLCAEPEGGWAGEYKTNKYVMRLIEPGTFEKGRDLISLSVNGMKTSVQESSRRFEFTAEIPDASVGETLIWKSNAPEFTPISTTVDGTTCTVIYEKASAIGNLQSGEFYEMYAETPDGIRSNPVHFGILGKDPIIYFKTPQDNIVVKVNEPLDFQVFFYPGEGESGTPSINTRGTGCSRSFMSGVKIEENESVSWSEPGHKLVTVYFEKNGNRAYDSLYITVIDADVPQEIAVTQPFYSAVFETTQKQWNLVTGSDPSYYKGDTRPVEQVSWNTIREDSFLGVLQEKTGLAALDLPTSEQWEYACRAGSTMEYSYFEDKNLIRHYENRNDGRGGYDAHTVVGSYEPNAWGLFDTRGNVWEWCLEQKVCGGGWSNSIGYYYYSYTLNVNGPMITCVPSSQREFTPSKHSAEVGFRLVQSMSDENRLVCSGTSNSISVGKKPAAITVDPDQGKVYGEADPMLTATVTGTEDGDRLNYTLSRVEGKNVGTYDIKVNLGENPKYEITVTEDKFTITRKPASITVDPNQSKIYGEKDPDIFSATVEGTVGTDKLNYSLSRTGGENVGEYPITITLGENPNYAVTATNGSFAIQEKTLSITANSAAFTYNGTAQSDPGYTVDGLVGNDAVEAVVSGSITFPREGRVKNQVTSYSFTAGLASNYTITTVDGELTMSKAAAEITLTAASGSWVYDGKDHANSSVTLRGTLFSGDELTAEAEGSVKDVRDTAAGNNTVKASYTVKHGVEDVTENYVVTCIAGKLEITPKPASVTVDDNQGKTYGEDDPVLTATVEGAVEGETLNYELTRADGEDAGDYAISVLEKDNPNYDVTTMPGTFTIRPLSGVTVTITGRNNTSVYDDEEHTVDGYDAEASSALYDTEKSIAFSGTAEASRTEVGTTFMGLTADQFRNVNGNFSDVTFNVTDGYQEIAETDKTGLNQIIDDAETYRDRIADDYPEIAERLDEAIGEAKGIAQDPNVTAEEVKAAADALDEALEAAKDLASDKDEFGSFKEQTIPEVLALREPEDSGESVAMILRAVSEIRSLPYDEEMTLDENIERILDIVSDLERDLAAQRRREFYYLRSIAEALRRKRELDEEKRKAALKEAEEAARLPFTDVPADLEPIIRYVYENGIMNGVGGDRFDPQGSLTRGMIVTILWRMEGEPAVPYSGAFTDVPAGTWYTDGVEWAASRGIVLGYGDGTYGPDKPVTREQVAVILYRYAQFKGVDTSVGEDTNILSYDDAFDISSWAFPAMQWACGTDVLDSGNTAAIRPGEPASRAEIARAIRVFLADAAK